MFWDDSGDKVGDDEVERTKLKASWALILAPGGCEDPTLFTAFEAKKSYKRTFKLAFRVR